MIIYEKYLRFFSCIIIIVICHFTISRCSNQQPIQVVQSDLKYIHPLNIKQFYRKRFQQNIKVIDIRGVNIPTKKFIKDVIIFYIHPKYFKLWVQRFVTRKKQLLIYGETPMIFQVIELLTNLNYTNIKGYGFFSISQWQKNHYPIIQLGKIRKVSSKQNVNGNRNRIKIAYTWLQNQ